MHPRVVSVQSLDKVGPRVVSAILLISQEGYNILMFTARDELCA